LSKKNNRASNGYGQDNRKLLTQKNKQKASSSPAATTTTASTSRASPSTFDETTRTLNIPPVFTNKYRVSPTNQPVWQPHSRRISTFENTPKSARANFHSNGGGIRKFEDVQMEAFHLDRRREHRNILAKRAAERNGSFNSSREKTH
jgi:hypothetical protein